MKKILIYIINVYQSYLSFDKGMLALLAPGGSCKYAVSCSEYTKQAIRDFGSFRGGWLGVKRIWSCR